MTPLEGQSGVPSHRPEYGDTPGWAVPSSDPRRALLRDHGQLVADDRPGVSDEERIAIASNEVRELHRRTEARMLFSEAGL